MQKRLAKSFLWAGFRWHWQFMTVFEYGNIMVLVDAGLISQMTNSLVTSPTVFLARAYVPENEDSFADFLITHGHEDHIGALPRTFYGPYSPGANLFTLALAAALNRKR